MCVCVSESACVCVCGGCVFVGVCLFFLICVPVYVVYNRRGHMCLSVLSLKTLSDVSLEICQLKDM